jgi:hypothetical protein
MLAVDRSHRRFSVRCPAKFSVPALDGMSCRLRLEIFELSRYGFQAYAQAGVPLNVWGEAIIQLGPSEVSQIYVLATRESASGVFDFELGEPDLIWRKFVNALYRGSTHADLENATRFMTEK